MIAIVSHDAGGAEVISSYVRQEGLDCLYVLEGPALKVFQKKIKSINTLTLDEAISQAETILCGTSWQSNLELNAIKLAREKGKHTISFIDHWVNYHDRFEMNGSTVLPDEIWVGDHIAKSLVNKIFPEMPVTLIENPYFKDIIKDLSNIAIPKKDCSESNTLLYICEPLSEHANLQYGNKCHWGYVEEDALRYFLNNVTALTRSYDRIIIRPHPSERENKYNWVLDEYNLPIEIGGVDSLLKEILQADIVAGCQSTAMVVGLLAKKRIVSCIPSGGASCGLPHKDIEHLQNIVRN